MKEVDVNRRDVVEETVIAANVIEASALTEPHDGVSGDEHELQAVYKPCLYRLRVHGDMRRWWLDKVRQYLGIDKDSLPSIFLDFLG